MKAQMFLLREKCPNTEFLVVRIQSECDKILARQNSVLGLFSRNLSVTPHSYDERF